MLAPAGSDQHGHADSEEARTTSISYPKVAAFVRLLKLPWCQVVVVIIWFLMSVGGLISAKSFIKELESDIPPIKGTPTYDAAQQLTYFFPDEPLGAALLAKSADGSAFLNFVNTSTCDLGKSIDPSAFPNVTMSIFCKPKDQTVLGGGCIIKSDLISQAEAMIQNMSSQLQTPIPPDVVEKLMGTLSKIAPNITMCPVATGRLTEDFLTFSQRIDKAMASSFPTCSLNFQSLDSIPPTQLNKTAAFTVPNLGNITLTIATTLPAGMLWELAKDSLLADSFSTALVGVLVTSCNGTAIDKAGKLANDIANQIAAIAVQESNMKVQVNSIPLMLAAVQAGIEKTMDLASLTLPVALLILAAMVTNARLVLCTIVNLIACMASAILIMYPLAMAITVSTTAPSLMIAVSLAMSIDYSLFLFTRFQKELAVGRSVDNAVTVMLATSGKIVVASGMTLLLCFLMMLSLEAQVISSIGISAAVTVLMAVAAAVTLTPTLLLVCPAFFSSNKRYGLSLEGFCCSAAPPSEIVAETRMGPGTEQQMQDKQAEEEEQMMKRSCWPAFGQGAQKLWAVVFVALLALAIPIGVASLPHFKHSCGLLPLMPSDSDATHSLLDLQDAFGVGALFPVTLLLVPPPGATATDSGRAVWLEQTCQALQAIAADVNTDRNIPAFTAKAFNGAMILNGTCTTTGLATWSNLHGPYSATKVSISYAIDPFSSEGQAWMLRIRSAVNEHTDVATWYMAGDAATQMDVANKTFSRFPFMIVLMMVIVVVLLTVSFKSIVAPLRAVFCLLWMLTVTIGLAIFTYQNNMLGFLGMSQLAERRDGAMHFMSPCVAFSVLVGLGLDYDIFYTERVIEECEHGHAEPVSAVRALTATANIISAAGFIMAAAFFALLLSSSPTLNEIAFLLIVGVLIDCAITTKIIIPVVIGVLRQFNFWPRKFESAQRQANLNISLIGCSPANRISIA